MNNEMDELRTLLGYDLKEKKRMEEKEKTSRASLSQFFCDLAKTSFTAMVAGAAVALFTSSENKYHWVLLVIGIFASISFAYVGYLISKR